MASRSPGSTSTLDDILREAREALADAERAERDFRTRFADVLRPSTTNSPRRGTAADAVDTETESETEGATSAGHAHASAFRQSHSDTAATWHPLAKNGRQDNVRDDVLNRVREGLQQARRRPRSSQRGRLDRQQRPNPPVSQFEDDTEDNAEYRRFDDATAAQGLDQRPLSRNPWEYDLSPRREFNEPEDDDEAYVERILHEDLERMKRELGIAGGHDQVSRPERHPTDQRPSRARPGRKQSQQRPSSNDGRSRGDHKLQRMQRQGISSRLHEIKQQRALAHREVGRLKDSHGLKGSGRDVARSVMSHFSERLEQDEQLVRDFIRLREEEHWIRRQEMEHLMQGLDSYYKDQMDMLRKRLDREAKQQQRSDHDTLLELRKIKGGLRRMISQHMAHHAK